jgi:hypothetical protein
VKNFAGKEYDTVTLVPAYLVSTLVVNTLDAEVHYPVDIDTNFAFLQNSQKNEVVEMFYTLDVNRIRGYFLSQGVTVAENLGNVATSEESFRSITAFIGQGELSFITGDIKVTFNIISFLDKKTGVMNRVADVENVTLNKYRKNGEEWDEVVYRYSIGFKKTDPTGYFIEELSHLLRVNQ